MALGNFFHQENFEKSERDDNPMERGQDGGYGKTS